MDYVRGNLASKEEDNVFEIKPNFVYEAFDGYTIQRDSVYCILKRIFDVASGFAALIILSPLMLIVALAIKLDSPGKVLYSQERVGRNGKIFKMYKFRSMVEKADTMLDDLKHLNEMDGPVFKITNDPRVTKVGKFIRSTSIDELPQLFNILKGEMSVVGPRPPLVHEAEKYTEYENQRLSVEQGLTCYWQISGRSDVSFREWIEMDLKYIKEQGIKTDLKIIFLTFAAVIKRKGAY